LRALASRDGYVCWLVTHSVGRNLL